MAVPNLMVAILHQHLRRHVLGTPAVSIGELSLLATGFGQSEVRDLHLPIGVDEDVL